MSQLDHLPTWDEITGQTPPADQPIPLGDARDVPPFPTEVFPDWIRAQVEQTAVEFQFAADLPAQTAITALSIACARRVRVHVDGPHYEHVNTYLVTAMDSSDGKSPCMAKLLGPIEDHQDELIEAATEKARDAAIRRKVLEQQQRKAINSGDTAEALALADDINDLEEPPTPRLIVDDVTPEKLGELMAEQGGRIALVSTEAGVFAMMARGYRDQSDLDVYLKGWSGDTYSSDRISRTTGIVRNACITLGLAVQPSVIEALREHPEFHGRGLVARLMMSLPRSSKGYRDRLRASTYDPDVAARYADRLLGIIRQHDTPDACRTLELSPEAVQVFKAAQQDHEVRMRPGGDLEYLAQWSAKCLSTVARVAGLLHVADGSHDDEIDAQTMRRALTVGDYWVAHAKLAGDLWGADPVVAQARWIVEWAAREERVEFSVRDVYNANRRMFPRADDTVPALNLLTERLWITPQFDGELTVGRRGMESPVFTVREEATALRQTVAVHANHAP